MGHRGGTLIISDEKTIPHVEDLHREASMVVARYSFNGKNMDIASVYAPSDPTKRIKKFSHMNQHLTKYTLVGGDWNCVPDVTTDVKGKNALSYKQLRSGTTRKENGGERPHGLQTRKTRKYIRAHTQTMGNRYDKSYD